VCLKNMNKKNLLKFLYFIIIFISFFILILLFLQKKVNINPDLLSAKNSLEQTSIYDLPLRLYIPRINIDASIEQVGLTHDNKMDIPKGPDVVGWFNLGTIPGDIGSSVMAGHFGWKDNIPAIFDNLHRLKIGDKIYVENEKKEITVFVVRDIRKYNKNENTDEIFYSNDSIAHLNLITCIGSWNTIEQSHNERLVIFTDKILSI
jgi:LPXTG-site transpeptidase (sortase) family protein